MHSGRPVCVCVLCAVCEKKLSLRKQEKKTIINT